MWSCASSADINGLILLGISSIILVPRDARDYGRYPLRIPWRACVIGHGSITSRGAHGNGDYNPTASRGVVPAILQSCRVFSRESATPVGLRSRLSWRVRVRVPSLGLLSCCWYHLRINQGSGYLLGGDNQCQENQQDESEIELACEPGSILDSRNCGN
nr:hypothetical protein [Candidatus Sigynarchaeota archaeon]